MSEGGGEEDVASDAACQHPGLSDTQTAEFFFLRCFAREKAPPHRCGVNRQITYRLLVHLFYRRAQCPVSITSQTHNQVTPRMNPVCL
ncbi:hypothetical protein EYF80_041900 [Liparis tanakae]|uniref:Uncharacterized protein n=1 Tax=Liparis tanakae TaxID=230148 RepID=A0A4Z2G311_9TELE|nr:hypothetical protein EYF80_041900 [Liparis tanakae]